MNLYILNLLPDTINLVFVAAVLLFTLLGLAVSAIICRRQTQSKRVLSFRIIASGAILLGSFYIVWRYLYSININALWFSLPLLLAETYSFINSILFALMMWKPVVRTAPEPLDDASVDIYITTYNEDPALLEQTVQAACNIDWEQKSVYILDDGNRPEMRELASVYNCTVITRGPNWEGKPRHAKAGNVNNALLQTSGEYILILDADQIPSVHIIRRIIGYFRDPGLAFVQTPQHFYNIPPGDPFGSDAPLFYGPILEGKDGWNAAFFCGSNALLRREALIRLGITDYAQNMIRNARILFTRMKKKLILFRGADAAERELAVKLKKELRTALKQLKARRPVEEIFSGIRRIIKASPVFSGATGKELPEPFYSFLSALEITRSNEAMPILPLSTSSITEDMATAMRLHAQGWKSVFHNEILAQGLAPEDLGSVISQRLRWAQGTIQVLVHDNPLRIKGLSPGQRLQYFTTIFSYFSGFAYAVFLLSPILFLFTGIAPLSAYSSDFFWRLVPFLLFNRIMFRYAARGLKIKRGEQYSIALFPVWIRAVLAVLLGRETGFVVTPKKRQQGTFLALVRVQLCFILLSLAAMLYAAFAYIYGSVYGITGLVINAFWVLYNIAGLSVIVRAAFYHPPSDWSPAPSSRLGERLEDRADTDLDG